MAGHQFWINVSQWQALLSAAAAAVNLLWVLARMECSLLV